MHISDLSTAKYKSEKEIEAAKEAAGITYGEWFNDKVVFGYNYVDVNTVLKEEDKRSHGMHVTSIATGNPTQPVAGQLMYGVAPGSASHVYACILRPQSYNRRSIVRKGD